MELKRDRQPARVALIIFIALVIFCLAQLTWWVIFHIKSSGHQKEFRLQAIGTCMVMTATTANHEFNSLANTGRSLLDSPHDNLALFMNRWAPVLSDPIVIGYRISLPSRDIDIQGGIVDSTFHAVLQPGVVLYFDPEYPRSLISGRPDGEFIEFNPAGYHNGAGGIWVEPGMFSISPVLEERLDADTRRTIVMFAGEGGFFLLIMLFGAFLIYRTLYRAEELKFRQQNFLHSVTHELKAPLASIRLYLETIMGGRVDGEKIKGLYPKMLDDCDRLEGLIDNVLEAGHFSKAGYQLKTARTCLSADLEEYLDGLEGSARRFGGDIKRDISPDIFVKSDYQAMGRVVNSLIDNAFRYSPPDRREVTVGLVSDDRYAIMRIADRGAGIDASERKKIFERFYRGGDEELRGTKGSGLGLFLVREIVEAHDGTVTAESPGKDKGSVFVVKLPLAKP